MTAPLEVRAQLAIVEAMKLITISEIANVSAFPRMLDGTDPTLSVGVFFMAWAPADTPVIGGRDEPVICRYTFGVQTFLKESQREAGEAASAVFVKRVRNVLYRDPVLLAAISILADIDDDGAKERFLRRGIATTDYADGAIAGGFAFLSQTEFYIDTEVA